MKNIIAAGHLVPSLQNPYYVSRCGRIFKQQQDGTLLPLHTRTDRAGYITVRLLSEGKYRTMFVHRLVAAAYVDNPRGCAIVNHANGIKTDNRAENLEWVNHAENIRHAYHNGLINQVRKERRVIDQKTGRIFKSANEASMLLKIPYSTLKNSLNGNRPNRTSLLYYEREMEAA